MRSSLLLYFSTCYTALRANHFPPLKLIIKRKGVNVITMTQWYLIDIRVVSWESRASESYGILVYVHSRTFMRRSLQLLGVVFG